MSTTEYPKKLIEVALPLDDINAASAREKSIRHGHPSTLHLWWARRPLAAARAVLFAQLVNDPGGKRGYGKYKGQTKADAQKERERLFKIIRELVKWENTNNEGVLELAREEIRKSWRETCELTGEDPEKIPPFLDPFAGGGSIPLEAQRLGLEAHASDLNPVAVMINKAMIEIPPQYFNCKPIGPIVSDKQVELKDQSWPGTKGLAEDIRRYAHVMNKEAWKKIGHLYPQIDLPKENGGGKATPLVFLWARTVLSPNPAFNQIYVPLVSSFTILNTKNNKAWIEPVIRDSDYDFIVHQGPYNGDARWKSGTKAGRGSFKCLLSETPINLSHIKEQGMQGKLKRKLMAILVEINGKKCFVNPNREIEDALLNFKPIWKPTEKLSTHQQYMGPPRYGIRTIGDLFTPQQLLAINTFSELLPVIYKNINTIKSDEYARSIITYLAFSLNKCTDYWSTVTTWMPRGTVGHVFSTHVLPMTWDFPEINPFTNFHCSWINAVEWVAKQVENNFFGVNKAGNAKQCNASKADFNNMIVSTDPPYYDNVPYADISDYFYIWLRKNLKSHYEELFSSILVPKNDELVADVSRWGADAQDYFMNGMKKVMHNIMKQGSPYFPITIYYAFNPSSSLFSVNH